MFALAFKSRLLFYHPCWFGETSGCFREKVRGQRQYVTDPMYVRRLQLKLTSFFVKLINLIGTHFVGCRGVAQIYSTGLMFSTCSKTRHNRRKPCGFLTYLLSATCFLSCAYPLRDSPIWTYQRVPHCHPPPAVVLFSIWLESHINDSARHLIKSSLRLSLLIRQK